MESSNLLKAFSEYMEDDRQSVLSSKYNPLKKEIKQASAKLRKENYHRYLRSEEWKRKREYVLRLDDFKCRLCGAMAEHVHHLTYERVYNEPYYVSFRCAQSVTKHYMLLTRI